MNKEKILYLIFLIVGYLILLRNILTIILPTGSGIIYNLNNPFPGWLVLMVSFLFAGFMIMTGRFIQKTMKKKSFP